MDKKIIEARWWIEHCNFGDVLTPYIIEKLSGLKVILKYNIWYKEFIIFIKHIYHRKSYNFARFKYIYIKDSTNILGVGSILGFLSTKNSIAWGAGFININERFKGKIVCAVRGKLSEQIIQKQGIKTNGIYGDPSLLLPLIYKKNIEARKRIAIIPNFSEISFFQKKYKDIDIIDLRNTNIEEVIDQILSYRYILSSSLHGLIVSQAYGVPSLWIEHSVLANDSFHFKFRDYFSSVGIEYYEPFKDIDYLLKKDIDSLFKDNLSKYKILNLHEIQCNLLKVAPFPLLEQYHYIIGKTDYTSQED